jgi:hypothetical protein
MALTYEILGTYTGNGGSSFTFSSIPGTYTDLRLVVKSQTYAAAPLLIRVNGNTGNNYIWQELRAVINGYFSRRVSGINALYAGGEFQVQANNPALLELDIFGYTNSSINIPFLMHFGQQNGSAADDSNRSILAHGQFTLTNITSISVITTSNFDSPSTFTLFGIKRA